MASRFKMNPDSIKRMKKIKRVRLIMQEMLAFYVVSV